jgi:2-haloacid dehalogenase
MTRPAALAFDVFGTVVDWYSSIAQEAAPFLARHLPKMDPSAFALEWRSLYQPAMACARMRSMVRNWHISLTPGDD